MSINPLSDISKVYLEQVVESSHLETDMKKRHEANEKAVEDMKKTAAYKSMAATAAKKFDEALDPVGKEDSDVDNDGKKNTKKDKYLLNRRQAIAQAISTQEEKEVKKWWDDDGDGKGYEEGEVSGKFKRKKKVTKEGYSNWRQDLAEVMTDTKAEKKITEKQVNNKVVINPKLDLGEAVENLGGQLIEMVEIENIEGIFDDMSDSEIFLLSDKLIEEVVEEFFYECIEEGYDAEEVENVLVESIELTASILNEAKVTLGHDTKIKSDRLEKVKSAVKKVGKAVARGAGYVAGAAVRGARAAGREFKAGYARGSGGSSTAPTSSSSSGSSSSSTGSSRPGLLGRIGSALKSGLKKAVAKGARAVSRGARNIARKMEGGSSTPAPAKPEPKAETKKPAPKAKTTTKKKKSNLDDLLADIRKESKEVTALGSRLIDTYDKAPYSDYEASPKDSDKMVRKAKALKGVVRKEEIKLDEKILTSAETKEKERIVKSMKDKAADFEKRYPGRGKEVMYATATKMAKKIAEQAMELQPKTQSQSQQPNPAAKQIQQKDIQTKKRLLQQKMAALNRGSTDIDV
jgi:hypothetical protein